MCVDGHRWWGDHWRPQWVGLLWDPIVGFQFRVKPGDIVLLHLLVVFHSAKTIGSLGGESCSLGMNELHLRRWEHCQTRRCVQAPIPPLAPPRPQPWSQEREGGLLAFGLSVSCGACLRKNEQLQRRIHSSSHVFGAGWGNCLEEGGNVSWEPEWAENYSVQAPTGAGRAGDWQTHGSGWVRQLSEGLLGLWGRRMGRN